MTNASSYSMTGFLLSVFFIASSHQGRSRLTNRSSNLGRKRRICLLYPTGSADTDWDDNANGHRVVTVRKLRGEHTLLPVMGRRKRLNEPIAT